MTALDGQFNDRVAIVTGATSGIGKATAIAFAARGAKVVVAGRRAELGEDVTSEIRRRGGEAIFVGTDVRDPLSVQNLVATTMQTYGKLDCAFNNAGIPGEYCSTSEYTVEAWDEVMTTNLRGLWLCMKYELEIMLSKRCGAIVNNASEFAMAGSGLGIAPYVASKHGVLGITRAAGVECAALGVRVNAVCPGFTRTRLAETSIRDFPDRFNAYIKGHIPIGRIAEPEEIAAGVLWLCSDQATFVTGQALVIDGGALAQ